jgi:hypothetical protein
MKKIIFTFILFTCLRINGQVWDSSKSCEVDGNGNCTPTTLLTALPFLRISPDARGGAMGDVGIALDPTASSMHYNPSSLVFAKDESGVSLNFTPWLQALGVDDLYLTYLSLFKKLNKNEAIGGHVRYFSLGAIVFTDITGFETGVGKPREFEIGLAYARKLGDNLSVSLAPKFLYSNLAGGQVVGGVFINNAISFGADVSMTYRKKTKIGGYDGAWAFGANMSNLGAKISYTASADRDFLPTNLGLGGMLKINFDDYNSLSFGLDLNKLLVPSTHSISNPDFDKNNNGIADQREKNLFDGVFSSFSDAQRGFGEELEEISASTGVEYTYANQFAARAGYFYEHDLKGGRKYLTFGAGIKYNVFEFNISYLAPSSIQRTPLDNTLRFGLNFNFEGFQETLEE